MTDFLDQVKLLCSEGWRDVVEHRMNNAITIGGERGLDSLLRVVARRRKPPFFAPRLKEKVSAVYDLAIRMEAQASQAKAELDTKYGREDNGQTSVENLLLHAQDVESRVYLDGSFRAVRTDYDVPVYEKKDDLDGLDYLLDQVRGLVDVPSERTLGGIKKIVDSLPEALSFEEFGELYGEDFSQDIDALIHARELVPAEERERIPWEELRSQEGRERLYLSPALVEPLRALVATVQGKSDEDLVHPDSLANYRHAKANRIPFAIKVLPEGWTAEDTIYLPKSFNRTSAEALSACTFRPLPGIPGGAQWQKLIDMIESWQAEKKKDLRIHLEPVVSANDLYTEPQHVLHAGPKWSASHTALGVIGKESEDRFGTTAVQAREDRYQKAIKTAATRQQTRETAWEELPETLDGLAAYTPSKNLASVACHTGITGEAPCLYRVRFVAGQGKSMKPFIGYLHQHWKERATLGWEIKDTGEGHELVGLTKSGLLEVMDEVRQHNLTYDCQLTEGRSIGTYNENAYRVELEIVSIDSGNYAYEKPEDVWEPGSRPLLQQAREQGCKIEVSVVDPRNPKESYSYNPPGKDSWKTSVAFEGKKQDVALGEVEIWPRKYYGATTSHGKQFTGNDQGLVRLQNQVLEHNRTHDPLELRIDCLVTSE